MSLFEQYKHSKQLWVITALVLVLALSLGVLAYLLATKPASVEMSDAPESSTPFTPPLPSSSWEAPSSSLASSEEPSSIQESSSAAPIPARPSVPVVTPSVSSPAVVLPAQTLTIANSGVYDHQGNYQSITISASDVLLANQTIAGDLVLTDAVGQGAVALRNLVVKGRIVINGGSALTLENVTAAELCCQRAGGITTLMVKGTSTVNLVTARNHLLIDETNLDKGFAGVRRVVTQTGAPIWQSVTLTSTALDSLMANDVTNVMLDRASSIDTLTANARVHLSGGDAVGRLVVAADNVTYDGKPKTIEVKTGYADPSANDVSIGETETESGAGAPDRMRLDAPTHLSISDAEAAQAVTLSFVFSAHSQLESFSITPIINGQPLSPQTVAANARSLTLIDPRIGTAGTALSFSVYAVSRQGTRCNSPVVTSAIVTARCLVAPVLAHNAMTGGADGRIKVTFPAVSGATGYHVTPSATVAGQTTDRPTITLTGDMTTCSFAPAPLNATAYSARIVALGNGSLLLDAPPVTASAVVSTLPAPASPTVTAGTDGKLIFSFGPVAGASGYSLTPVCHGIAQTAVMTGFSTSGGRLIWQCPVTESGDYTFSVVALGDTMLWATSSAAQAAVFPVTQMPAPAVQQLTLTCDASGRVTLGGVPDGATVTAATFKGVALVPHPSGQSLVYEAPAAVAAEDVYAFTLKTAGNGVTTLDATAQRAFPVQEIAPPNDLMISNQNGMAAFSFAAVADAAEYAIDYRVANGSPIVVPAQEGVFDYPSTLALTDGQNITLTVSSRGDGVLTVGSRASCTVAVQALAPPSSGTVLPDTHAENSVLFSFQSSSNPPFGYEITAAGGSAEVDGAVLSASPYVYGLGKWDTEASKHVTLSVVAKGGTRNHVIYLASKPLSVSQTVAQLAAPTALTMTQQSDSSYLLRIPSVENAQGYHVA
ncbi:MAG: hypothetical protein RR135_01800, partial [Oscillospiraceae bacterium]